MFDIIFSINLPSKNTLVKKHNHFYSFVNYFFFQFKTSHTNISTLSFLKLFFLENLKLTKNNYLQTKLELLLYSILSLIKDVYDEIVRK